MTQKYIDAEKLYKQIDSLMAQYAKLEKEYEPDDEELSIFYQGKTKMCSQMLRIIDSLQQEQTLTDCNELQEPEVDLEKEVEKYFQGLWPGMETAEQCNTDMHFTPPAIMRLAKHFYELKNNAK